MPQENLLVIELEPFRISAHTSRIAPFLAVWPRISGLLLQVRLSACKILQFIQPPSAYFGRCLNPQIDEGQNCIRSFSLFSSNHLLDGRLSDLPIGHAELPCLLLA